MTEKRPYPKMFGRLPTIDDTFERGIRDLAASYASAESKALDEAIAALIRAGADIDRLMVEYYPYGLAGYSTKPFSRVVTRKEAP